MFAKIAAFEFRYQLRQPAFWVIAIIFGLMSFGMVAASGVKMLQHVDFNKTSNLLVVACSVSMGVGAAVVTPLFAKMPEMFHILFGSGIVSGSVTAILLNLFFNFDEVMGKSSEQIFNEVAHVDEGVF